MDVRGNVGCSFEGTRTRVNTSTAASPASRGTTPCPTGYYTSMYRVRSREASTRILYARALSSKQSWLPGQFGRRISRPALFLLCFFCLTTRVLGITMITQQDEHDGDDSQTSSCTISRTLPRVITSDCVPCPLSRPTLCPPATEPITGGTGDRGCTVPPRSSTWREIIGCSQQCQSTDVIYECCPGHWGPMCTECPGGADNPCNGRGSCQDRSEGLQCQCDPDFTGVSCELCARDDVYGSNCDQVCDCVYGVCSSGPMGDGFCLCEADYQGPRCDQAKIRESCGEPACHPFAICSPPVVEEGAPQCACSPGYSGDGRTSCIENDPCLVSGICSPHAVCNHTSPGKHSCHCREGYYGDGVECYPVNYCQRKSPPCPQASTDCVFDGPGQYHCECKEGYQNYTFPIGCQWIDLCAGPEAPRCPPHSICTMMPERHTTCECIEGFKGDGENCYGSILQVLRDINSDADMSLLGSLDSVISALDFVLGYLLSGEGSFTVFAPTDEAFREADRWITNRSTVDADFTLYLMKLHVIPAYLDAYALNTMRPIYTLSGMAAEVSHRGHNSDLLRYQLESSNTQARIVHTDIPAANGVIHVIDQLLYEPPLAEMNPTASVTSILSTAGRFSQFQMLLSSVGVGSVIPPGVPYTVLAPVNKAFNQISSDGTMDHLMSAKGRTKLLALLKNHIIEGSALTMQNLISDGHFVSMYGATTTLHIYPNGLIATDSGANVTFSDIVAIDGYVHSIDGLLIPLDIIPLIPHRCDIEKENYFPISCFLCNRHIPRHSWGPDCSGHPLSISIACLDKCCRTRLEPECCSGFYGESCLPCPGGSVSPCSGHGQCADLIRGNGRCTCEANFTGTACELCLPNLFGPRCHQTCTCLKGICDDGPQGTGHCRGGCILGFTGMDCDIPAQGCGPQVHICHEHAFCDSSGDEIRCMCQAGYTGSGLHCEPQDPCTLPERGRCHRQAICTYLGPGLSDCTCNTGWEGDGFECNAIDPCQGPDRGGCGRGAICAYIRPGVSQCHCDLGHFGNGTVCDPINPCLLMTNGGCDIQADCVHTGPGTSECKCRDGYGGNGWLCYQSLPVEISSTHQLRRFYEIIQLVGMEGFLASAHNLTVFAPSDDAIEGYEMTFGRVTQFQATSIVQMHLVNGTLDERDLYQIAHGKDQYITSLHPPFQIRVHDCNHSLCVNNIRVEVSEIPATNGLIHILGQVLSQWSLQVSGHLGVSHMPPPGDRLPLLMSLDQLISQTEPNSTFLALLQEHDLMQTLTAASLYTIFFPSNQAVASFNSSLITRDILRYHIILGQALSVADIYNGMHIDSSLGHNYQLRFRKESGHVHLFVNNVAVSNPDLPTSQGIVHIVSEVLVPLPNRCDINRTKLTQTACGNCRSVLECPAGTTAVVNPGLTHCLWEVQFLQFGRITVQGCRVLCRGITYIPQCCSGFFGTECAECPGGWASPCSNHGLCSDGTDGTGMCTCSQNFNGTACELCKPGRYGPLCNQVCNCAHGHCREGIHGDGRCICDHGFTGIRCDDPITSANSCTQECDINAYCSEQQCICYQGYTGNGTHCTVHDPCTESGFCSQYATCLASTNGQADCLCMPGYRGDGVYCEEINPCLEGDDGGCHEQAECIHTGPSMSTCHCNPGYEGNGRTRCSPVDPCQVNNGGCSTRAHCVPTGPAKRNCTCFEGHIGNGLVCVGNIAEELALNPSTSTFFALLEDFGDVMRVLGSTGPLTVLVPNNEAFNYISQEQIEEWRQENQLVQVLMNHLVSCSAFVTSSVNRTTTLTTLAAQPIHITYSSSQGLIVNEGVHVTLADYVTGNGIIHTIDRVLVPELLVPRPDYQDDLPFNVVAPNSTYSIFMELMNQVGLLGSLATRISLPVTIFMPTNEAFLELYPGKLAELRNLANIDKTTEYLKYHIIPQRVISTTQLAEHRVQGTTLQGSNITIECRRNQGFFINQDSKIIDTETAYQDGVFYGLDMVLEPPSIGGRCDIYKNTTTSTDCYSCSSTITCPLGSIPISGKIRGCLFKVGWYNYQTGCKRHCVRQETQPNCCSHHYGPDCRECPGGRRNPCSWHGVCDDGNTGSGQCMCDEGFMGVACERCDSGRFGPNCEECQCSSHDQCDDGLSGTGSCFCEADYVGIYCETSLPATPVCNPYCHVNAVCRPNNMCECRPKYYGNGYSCAVINRCGFENGGCSMYANCTQADTEFTCHCRDNYEGDGYICQPIDPCMNDRGGCHSEATCKHIGPNSRTCTCNPPLQGDGITCSMPSAPKSTCTIDNGGCHKNARCFDSTNTPVGPPEISTVTSAPQFRSPSGFMDGLLPSVVGVRCECKPGYVGTGFLCNGNAFDTLSSMKNLSVFYHALLAYEKTYPKEGKKLTDLLKSEMSKLTLFIPINSDLLRNITFNTSLVENHVVSGQSYNKKQLVPGLSLTSLCKGRLMVTWSSDKRFVLINNVPVKIFDIPMTNGILHIVSGPIMVDFITPNKEKNPNNDSSTMSVSKVFAGILIAVFFIILAAFTALMIFIMKKKRRRRDTIPIISRYSVNGSYEDGSVTFSHRYGDIVEEEEEIEEDMETSFRTRTVRRPVYNATDMDSDTVGFAETL